MTTLTVCLSAILHMSGDAVIHALYLEVHAPTFLNLTSSQYFYIFFAGESKPFLVLASKF